MLKIKGTLKCDAPFCEAAVDVLCKVEETVTLDDIGRETRNMTVLRPELHSGWERHTEYYQDVGEHEVQYRCPECLKASKR